jgi:hypothetical protein
MSEMSLTLPWKGADSPIIGFSDEADQTVVVNLDPDTLSTLPDERDGQTAIFLRAAQAAPDLTATLSR